MERRLTTILAADVAGYSRLMGADEGGTLAALKALRRELLKPKEAQYRGRTVKLMGDGALMEFASVVDAVSFAVEIQVGRQIPEQHFPIIAPRGQHQLIIAFYKSSALHVVIMTSEFADQCKLPIGRPKTNDLVVAPGCHQRSVG